MSHSVMHFWHKIFAIVLPLIAGLASVAPADEPFNLRDHLTLSASDRVRGEFVSWFDPAGPKSDNNYNFFANRLRAGASLGFPTVEFVIEGQDTRMVNLPGDDSIICPPLPVSSPPKRCSIPPLLENVSFYDVLGLCVDRTQYAPDHLVPQLEFLSAVRYARESTPEADNRTRLAHLERDFLERHLLNWVSTAQKKLAREHSPLFPTLMTLLLAFVQSRMRS